MDELATDMMLSLIHIWYDAGDDHGQSKEGPQKHDDEGADGGEAVSYTHLTANEIK